MITAILFWLIGLWLNAPTLYYILVIWKLGVEVINAYKDGKIRHKVKSLWVYRDAPRSESRGEKFNAE